MYHIQVKPRKNSKKYSKTIADLKDEQEVLNYLEDNNLYYLSTPYFFTHIRLSNETIITQTATVAGQELPCSPIKLEKLLTNK